jgi:hypothetical protein
MKTFATIALAPTLALGACYAENETQETTPSRLDHTTIQRDEPTVDVAPPPEGEDGESMMSEGNEEPLGPDGMGAETEPPATQ